ncbi:MAG TPA: AAA family ATPase [Pseudomonadales bacterium]|nr:AAA family ATPase [Pseudomonadales bacterium]
MKCPRCQMDNRADARFCEECGARMEQSCPACGNPVGAGKKFCGHCGVALTQKSGADRAAAPESYTPKHLAEKILTTRADLAGERKQVTVLFADLKGSMELLADRDPEEARRLLDPVLERMMEAVHRYEGTVNQVMGDGIMALFGAPLAHEDHAVRACYTAIRMQETVGAYAAELLHNQGIDVQIRVGLNSGEVVVRSIGSDLHMDYTAVGQTTHLAARMEQLARPGTSLITAHTLRLAEGFIEVKPHGLVPVKGLADPVEIFEVVGAGQVRSRMQASAARGLSPFVGRDAEIDRLRHALERARTGHGQVVALVGEPGVGKSRLFWEFTHSHRIQGWLMGEAAALSYGKLTPYLPVVGFLKSYFQIDDRDDARRIREKVTGKLLTLDETLRPALPAFLTLLDVPADDPEWPGPDSPQRRQRILDALKRLLLRESQVQPLLLVFEDLHWIDSETQAFLDSLVESLPTAQIMLLVGYRPEYQHGWSSRSHYTQLRLDPLPPATADELLRGIVGEHESLGPVKSLLVQRTEGNPFFLEECVRTLVETQVLVGERGVFRLVKPLTTIQVPATVQAVIASRIDRLGPEEKRLLQAAAVIGKDVPFTLLAVTMEMPEETLRARLTRLQQAEFLFETGLFPDLEFSFTHALTHGVAYGSLLQERRRTLHARILSTVEELYPERRAEQPEVLADHAFRGEVWGKAVTYLRQAGAKAAARSANREAVALLEQAMTALQNLPEGRETSELAIDVRLELRPPLLQLGELQKALALSQQAENMATLIGDEGRLARVYTYLINYHYLKGEPDAAIDYGERCLAIGEAGQDVALQSLARGYMGYSYHAQGRYREAEAVLLQNVERLEEVRVRDGGAATTVSYASSTGWLAFSLAELGEFDLAASYAAMGQRAAETERHAYAQAIAWTLAGLVALRRGHMEKALYLLERSLEACRDKQLTVWRPIPSSLLGLTRARLGRPEDALPLLEDGVRLSEELGVKAYLASWTVNLAGGLLAAGNITRARETAQRGLDLALAHKERGHQAYALRLLGEIAARSEPADLALAEKDLTQALAIAEELGMRPLLGRIHLSLGEMSRLGGDHGKAEAHIFHAVSLFRAMDMRHWLEEAAGQLKALGHLLVVAHYNLGLYDFLKERFAEDADVTVVLDRRKGERRRPGPASGSQRRGPDRRTPELTDGALRLHGFVVIPTEPPR